VIVAAADGSSLANPGPSGWAWYIDRAHWAAGGWAKATNNMGELMAVLDLLRATRGVDQPLRILCDSQYVINCCTRWIPGWKKRGWRKADNAPVLNRDLLEALDAELAGRQVTFQWVRGHAGHPLNERADTLARAAATAYQRGTPVATGPGYSAVPPPSGLPEDEAPPDAPAIPPTTLPAPDDGAHPTIPLLPEPIWPSQPQLFDLPTPPAAPPTDRPDADVVDVTELTRQLLSDQTQVDKARLDELMHPDFVAHLPEGVIRTKGSILARPATLAGAVQLDVLGADRFGKHLVGLRYRLRRNSQEFLCFVLWQRVGGHWQARFHQQTAVG
jgi:ribonuclease HI